MKTTSINIRLEEGTKSKLQQKAGLVPVSAVARALLEAWERGDITLSLEGRVAAKEVTDGDVQRIPS